MRLLSIIHAPVFGGAHNQLLALREPLLARGWETVAVMPDEAGTGVTRLRDAGVPTVTTPLHRPRATLSPRAHAQLAGGLAREVAALRAVIRRQRPDVVQVHGPTNPHGAIAARLERVPLVWQVFDTRTPVVLRRLTRPLLTGLADAVTTWGEALADAHPGVRGLGDRVVVVYPPVDLERFRRRPGDPEAARRRLGVPDGALVVGAVGNLNPSKGHEHFVQVAAAVRRRRPDVVFRVLGAASPVHARYMTDVHATARRLGLEAPAVLEFRDAGTDVPRLLPAFDCLLSTSVPRSEGIPTAMLEAMAAGVPVVATRVGAVAELVEDGVTGFVVAPLDRDAAVEAVLRLLGEPALRAEMGATARRRAVERWSLDRLAGLHVHAFGVAQAHAGRRYGRGSSASR